MSSRSAWRPLPGDEDAPDVLARRAPLADRLWRKVAGNWLPGVGDDDCWLWLGARGLSRRPRFLPDNGRPWGVYGRIHAGQLGSTRKVGAHQAAFELTYGAIEDGLVVCHSCDNSLCCNPRHLFAATQSVNVAAAWAKGHRRRRATNVAA